MQTAAGGSLQQQLSLSADDPPGPRVRGLRVELRAGTRSRVGAAFALALLPPRPCASKPFALIPPERTNLYNLRNQAAKDSGMTACPPTGFSGRPLRLASRAEGPSDWLHERNSFKASRARRWEVCGIVLLLKFKARPADPWWQIAQNALQLRAQQTLGQVFVTHLNSSNAMQRAPSAQYLLPGAGE